MGAGASDGASESALSRRPSSSNLFLYKMLTVTCFFPPISIASASHRLRSFFITRRSSSTRIQEELANLLDQLEGAASAPETEEQRNKFLVLRLYEALNARDHAVVHSLLASDLEWWFHGPPAHQHMMRTLTGADHLNPTPSSPRFRFQPRSVDAFGSTVIAEGPPTADGKVYWVHAWTVGADGVITQLREYFNTDLTVTCLAAASKCVWQSSRPGHARNSLPGLVLAL